MISRLYTAITGRDPRWHRASRAYLKSNPSCVCCGQAATTVHHVVPVSRDKDLEMVSENWAAVCARCHFVVGHVCDWRDVNAKFWQTVQAIRDGHQQHDPTPVIATLGQFNTVRRTTFLDGVLIGVCFLGSVLLGCWVAREVLR